MNREVHVRICEGLGASPRGYSANLHFPLSYRDIAEIAWELGVVVAPSTILRSRHSLRARVRAVLAEI